MGQFEGLAALAVFHTLAKIDFVQVFVVFIDELNLNLNLLVHQICAICSILNCGLRLIPS